MDHTCGCECDATFTEEDRTKLNEVHEMLTKLAEALSSFNLDALPAPFKMMLGIR